MSNMVYLGSSGRARGVRSDPRTGLCPIGKKRTGRAISAGRWAWTHPTIRPYHRLSPIRHRTFGRIDVSI